MCLLLPGKKCGSKSRHLTLPLPSPTGVQHRALGLSPACFHHLLHSAIQDCLQTDSANRSSHLPEANRSKLSLTSSLSSFHMKTGVKPTSRDQIRVGFNIILDVTSQLNSDIPPLHPCVHSTEYNAPNHDAALPPLEMERGGSYQVNSRAHELGQ